MVLIMLPPWAVVGWAIRSPGVATLLLVLAGIAVVVWVTVSGRQWRPGGGFRPGRK